MLASETRVSLKTLSFRRQENHNILWFSWRTTQEHTDTHELWLQTRAEAHTDARSSDVILTLIDIA